MRPMLVAPAREDAIAGPGRGRLALLWIVTATAVVLHNAEEWLLNMTGWIAAHPWLPGRSLHGDPDEFAVVLGIVTLAVLGLAAVAVVARPRWSAAVLACLGYALAVNGASHALLSVVSWSPMPGVVSGIAVLLPIGVLLSRALPPVRWTTSTVVVTALAAVGLTAGAFAVAAMLTTLAGATT